MTPELGLSIPHGSRVSAGAQTLSFTGTELPAGTTLRINFGTSSGDDDISSQEITLPDTAGVTVPAEGPVYLAFWATTPSLDRYTYLAVWSVGVGLASASDVAHRVEVGYLAEHWKRTELASYADAPEVPDPGHGNDEICPIVVRGQLFDSSKSADTAPFTASEVNDGKGGGVGYLLCELRRLTRPEVVVPGARPHVEEEVLLNIKIMTPSGNGPELANLYAGVINTIFRFVNFRPSEGGYISIRNLEPPSDTPAFTGEDEKWRRDEIDIPLTRQAQRDPAGTQ